MSEKVLVTGGSGFIGSRIVENCIHMGLEVKVFDLVRSRNEHIQESIVSSILDPYAISTAALDCDYIIHAAGALGVQRTESQRLECLSINIQGTVNVLDAAVKGRIKKVLLTSSSEVYGDGNGKPFDEKAALNPKSNYAITKLVGEEYLRAYQQSYGLDYTIVRLFSIYGEGQSDQFVIPKFVRCVQKGRSPTIYGDGSQIRSFCHVDDAARGAVLALVKEGTSGEIFNIGNDSEPITILQLAQRVIAISQKEIQPVFVGFDSSDRNDRREIYKRVPLLEKASSLLGYAPNISLEEGLHRMLRVQKVGVLSGI